MGASSRRKGKRGELEAAAALREALGIEARRGAQHRGGPDSPDVVVAAGLHVEVKRCEALRLWEALEQATRDAPNDRVPVVLHRRSRKPWVLVVEVRHLRRLVETLSKGGTDDREGEEPQ